MIIEPEELQTILDLENEYLAELRSRWGGEEIEERAERFLRMGKRTELLGNLQAQKQNSATRQVV